VLQFKKKEMSDFIVERAAKKKLALSAPTNKVEGMALEINIWSIKQI
jgi:hypothetical protein